MDMDKEFLEMLTKKRSELTEMIEEARRLQLKYINEDRMKLILLRKCKIVKIWK